MGRKTTAARTISMLEASVLIVTSAASASPPALFSNISASRRNEVSKGVNRRNNLGDANGDQAGCGAQRGAPPNDGCTSAIHVDVPSSTIGTTVGAGVDSQFGNCGTFIDSSGVWYRVSGMGNTMTATTCNAIGNYDSKISVFCGDCEVSRPMRQMICVDGVDDDCDNFDVLLSTISWCSAAGQEYRILVHGFGGDSGNFRLDVSDDGVVCSNPPCCEPCDVNCDQQVNSLDIQSFVNNLVQSPSPCSPCAGDANASGRLDASDIAAFVSCLLAA